MADHSQTQHGLSRLRRALWLSSILSLSALLAVSQAQITLDGSLGPRMPLTGPTYRIEATMGQIRGRNLFHSFGQFHVRTDERVTFAGPNTIANIVSRVTGGSPSSIDGTMGSDIPEANLYLLNPAGVMFGPNARLDVSGSFHVSTADFLRFTDGAKFFVSMGQDSVLTCAAPTAFGFLGPMPAPITIQGSGLQGAPGSALSVVGGDITLGGGRLQATSGRIQLASVASPGEVVFSPLELAPDLQVDSFTRLGQIKLSQVSLLANGNGGGTVLIRGGRLVADNALINANTNGARDGARLGIDLHMADEIVLTNVNIFANSTGGAGRGGDIQITTGRLQVLGARSSISSSVLSSGDGGNITVSVNRFEMEGGPVGMSVVGVSVGDPTSAMIPLGATGKVGVLTVSARDSITLSGAASRLLATVGTASLGDAGSVSLWTPTLTMDKGGLIQAITLGNGNAGAIGVRVGRLTLTGGAQISSSTRSVGRGGQVTVEAADAISIAGQDSVGHASGLFSQATASGDAGSVMVKVGRLALTDGGQISTSSSGPGRGGQVTVEATDAIAISGRGSMGPSGLFSSTQAFGQGGTLQIAANQLQLSDGATISASSTGTGDAGPIQLQVGETFRSQNSLVTTATTESGGGAIALTAGRLVQLRDSALTTSVRGGGRDAGNITIDPQFVTVQNGQIRANAFEGRGGNIRITAGVFLADPNSRVDASSTLGINGQVAIQAPVTSISGAAAPLPQSFARAAELLRDRCAERLRGGTVSRFVLGGRDGVPLEPGSLLLSPLERGEQKGAVEKGEQERQNPEVPQEWIAQVQAPAQEEWEVACARWVGKPGTPATPKRSR